MSPVNHGRDPKLANYAYLSINAGTPTTDANITNSTPIRWNGQTHFGLASNAPRPSLLEFPGDQDGPSTTATNTGFAGDIALIRVYDTALTDEQLTAAYESVVGASPASAVKLTIAHRVPNLDFTWNSRDGKRYNLRSSAYLAADFATWTLVEGAVASTEPLNTKSISMPADPFLFYIVEEYPAPPLAVLSVNFDGADPGWTIGANNPADTGTTIWQLGDPSGGAAAGPTSAASGSNCYGTNIADTYGLNADIWLRTPRIDLGTAPGATLVFQQFRDIETGFDDRGSIRVLKAADDTQPGADLLNPTVGTSHVWEETTVALPAEALGQTIRLEFRFESDAEVNQAGWYIDDVVVTVPGS